MLAAAEKGATGDETASVEELQASVAKQGAVVKAAKAKAKDTGDEADKKASKDAIDELLKLKEQLNDAQASAPPSLAPGEIDYAMDFFGKPAYLAVSGQLNGACFSSPFVFTYAWCNDCSLHGTCVEKQQDETHGTAWCR